VVTAFSILRALAMPLAESLSVRGFGPMTPAWNARWLKGFGLIGPPVDRWQAQSRKPLDIAQEIALGAIAKRDGYAFGARARRASDAMDIAFGDFRKLVVDDMGHAINVDTARRDVGCDKRPRASGPERLERTFTLSLTLVAVNGEGCNSSGLKMLGDLIGAALRSSEDDGAGHHRIAEELDENVAFAMRLDKEHLLLYAIGRFCNGRHSDLNRIYEKLRRESTDLLWHGGGENQVLPLSGKLGDDPPDRLDEAKIEHLIDLIEDEKFSLPEKSRAGFDMIDETAGSCDEHIETACERLDLIAMRNAAKDDCDGEPKAGAEHAKGFCDLTGEFARRAEHQHARAATRGREGTARQMMQDRQCESGGLAGARLGYADEITARQDIWNGLGLDRSRCGKSLFSQRLQERRGKAKAVEISQ